MNVSHAKTMNPVLALRTFGQSIWLDYVGRSFIAGGALRRLIAEDNLGGVTSNPAIFEKAITGKGDHRQFGLRRRSQGIGSRTGPGFEGTL